ncbi:MAG: hypothetical protein LBI18_11265 [Planctomycetaceae bacterium]|jgi:hypothetical protein|nr:hypothetical protein [Planctomycetaceae bacterium]
MITFDCPVCGKHYTFSDRFGGHQMMCTGCRSSIVVPKIGEDIAPVKPPPLPIPSRLALPIPPLPNPPVSNPPLSNPSLSIPPLSVSPTTDPDDLEILAYVFAEKQQENGKLPPPPTPPSPPTINKTQNKKIEPETKKNSSLLYRGSLALIFLSFVGLIIFLIFYIDWRNPDPRPALLEKITKQKIQTLIEAKKDEIESETLRLRSLELWNQAGESIDAFIVTLGKHDTKLERNELTAEQQLNDLDNMIQTVVRQATETEIRRKNVIRNAQIYRAEHQFFNEQEMKLQEHLRQFPNDRSPKTMPIFDRENLTIPAKEPIMLGSDWTENLFDQLTFPEITVTHSYAAFDAIKRLYGDKSFRITLLERIPITVSFFDCADKNVVNNNLIIPEQAEYFTFSIRFPEMTELLRIGNDVDVGKIGVFRIRFVYSSGHIDFETVSPRYCNALFYDACGTFIPVEFPLTGDSFWKRTDHFESSKIADFNVEDSKIKLNEKPIDRIEICLTPLSNRTTVWFDGIALTEKMSHAPYDLLRAEIQQTEIRNRLKEVFKLQNSNDLLSDNNLSDDNSSGDNNNNMIANDSRENLPKLMETDSMNRLFRWVLQDAHGTIFVRRGDTVLALDSQKPVPNLNDAVIIEKIDLTGFARLTDEHLNQLGNLKTLKHLNLSRTGLRNENLIKLTTLTSLESLNLAENELTFEGLSLIRTLKGLKELNLDGIQASVDGIDAIGTLISLRSLSLSHSGMDNGDLMYLLPLAELETLNLSSTKIGDKGLPIFRVFTELRELDLSNTRITDNGLVSLIPLRHLRKLNLNDNTLSNTCLNSLGKIRGLEAISVFNTAITKEGVRQELSPAKFDCFQFAK